MDSLLILLPNSKRRRGLSLAIRSGEIIAAAETAGLQVSKIDLAKARGKSGLFDALAKLSNSRPTSARTGTPSTTA